MSADAISHIKAFTIGAILSNMQVCVYAPEFITTGKTIAIKLAVIIVTAFIGGFVSVFGKCAGKLVNKWYQNIKFKK